MRPLLALAIVGATAAPALSRDHADPLTGYHAGPSQPCLEDSRTTGPDVIDDRTILYRQSAQRVWRNDLPDRCPGLRQGVTLIVLDRLGERLCRGDRFRTIKAPSRVPGAECRLGSFTPFDKAAN